MSNFSLNRTKILMDGQICTIKTWRRSIDNFKKKLKTKSKKGPTWITMNFFLFECVVTQTYT